MDLITIIPGIELTVDPGFHIVLLFDITKKKEDIIEFCNSIGIDATKQSSSSNGISEPVLELLDRAKKFDCITIAPHVDSDKGIFTSLEQFKEHRSKIFSSKNLDAVTCNNEKVKSVIIELTAIDNKYKRNIPLAFLCGSDSHSLETVGVKKSYIKFESSNYGLYKTYRKNW